MNWSLPTRGSWVTSLCGDGGRLALRMGGLLALVATLACAQPVAPLGIGNAVFKDRNGNLRMDAGEGVPGAMVMLFKAGDDPLTTMPLALRRTDADGLYLFGGLQPGGYFVHLPASEFGPGAALQNTASLPGYGLDNSQDDDADDNGEDGTDPKVSGIGSRVIHLAAGSEPKGALGETGFHSADDDGRDGDVNLTVDFGFSGGCPVLAADPLAGALPSGRVGESYTQPLRVRGGAAPYAWDWSAVPPSQLPPGLVLDRRGVIHGTPVSPASHVIRFRVADAEGCPVEFTKELQILSPVTVPKVEAPVVEVAEAQVELPPPCPVLSLMPKGGSFSGMQGQSFSQSFSASGGAAPYTFAVDGDLPEGLTLSAEGVLSGRPVTAGHAVFMLRVTDARHCTADAMISFATTPAPTGTQVGNLVFVDANGNGSADPGEGMDGVTVKLKTPAGLVAQTVTAKGGLYAFANVADGTYFLEISADMFARESPLAGMKSLPGSTSSDDDAGEDGIDVPNPLVTGVRTAEFTVASGAAPAAGDGETGLGSATDDAHDAATDLTRDLGFTNALPRTFAQWQVEHPLNGQNGPEQNPDGDALNNALEFALGQPPGTGLVDRLTPPPCLKLNSRTGKFDFEFQRRLGGTVGTTFTLLLADEAGQEIVSRIVPAVVSAGNGYETVIYPDVEGDPAFQGLSQGLVRLRVGLSLDASPEAEVHAVTPAWCWRRHTVLAGASRSFAMPLVRQEVLRGVVTGVIGAALDVSGAVGAGGDLAAELVQGESYYVEVISGGHAGNRFEVDEAATAALTLTLDLESPLCTTDTLPDLTGAVIVVRQHQTLGSVMGGAAFNASSQQGTADRVLFFNRTDKQYLEHWLSLRAGNERRWVLAGDAEALDCAGQVIAPGEGLFVSPRRTTVVIPLVGLRRETDLRVMLAAGSNFVSSGLLTAAGPEWLSMTVARGFTAGRRAAQADRLRVWRNGEVSPTTPYAAYYLQDGGAGAEKWVPEEDAGNAGAGDACRMPAFEGVFIIHAGEPVLWDQEPPEQ